MAINYPKFLAEIDQTVKLVRRAIDEMQKRLVDDGFNLSNLPGNFKPLTIGPFTLSSGSGLLQLPHGWMYFDYMQGTLFFRRLLDELNKALDVLGAVDKDQATQTNRESQMTYDQLALRQRKLFEALTLIIMFAEPAIYSSNLHPLYFLHYHLRQDKERLSKRNLELETFFGGTCNEVTSLIGVVDNLVSDLTSNHISAVNCKWIRDERGKLMAVLPVSSMLEKVALGFGYQSVFGSSSSQIHLNMSGYFEPTTSESAFLHRVDNLMLLCVCTALRVCEIFERSGGTTGAAMTALRSEFVGIFPDRLASAILGAAEIGDLVNVFAMPDIFTGLVLNKRTASQFAAYEVTPLHQAPQGVQLLPNGTLRFFQQVGQKGWFGDIETMLCLRKEHQQSAIRQAIEDGFTGVDAAQSDAENLAEIMRTQEGQEKYVQAAMNKTLMPEMFFVQHYLQK
ncbi:MAG TPA: hypothetical protein V6C97_24200 [Oculatellaceae cyanobacterium]